MNWDTIFLIAAVVVVASIILGIIGSIFDFATGLIRTVFSLAGFAAVVVAGIWFFNGQSLNF